MSAFQSRVAHGCRGHEACCRLPKHWSPHALNSDGAAISPLKAEIAALFGEVTA